MGKKIWSNERVSLPSFLIGDPGEKGGGGRSGSKIGLKTGSRDQRGKIRHFRKPVPIMVR